MLVDAHGGQLELSKAFKNYAKAINAGLLKVFSKMGISTLMSYRGAQIFEAIGLNRDLVERHFTDTPAASPASACWRSPASR
jgi:glutamate synthase (NADPH/NADH) large chain/glutamate synthase (ferredoxin)